MCDQEEGHQESVTEAADRIVRQDFPFLRRDRPLFERAVVAGGVRWTGICIHHTAGRDTAALNKAAIEDYHIGARRFDEIGYHALGEMVEGRPQVIAGRPLHKAGAHAVGFNRTHLGFAIVSNYDYERENGRPVRRTPSGIRVTHHSIEGEFWPAAHAPDVLLRHCARFVAGWCASFRIPLRAVTNHRVLYEKVNKETACPGVLFPWDKFIQMIEEELL